MKQKSYEEILDELHAEDYEQDPKILISKIESTWKHIISAYASLLALGSGPASQLSRDEFQMLLVDSIKRYERVYEEAMKGR